MGIIAGSDDRDFSLCEGTLPRFVDMQATADESDRSIGIVGECIKSLTDHESDAFFWCGIKKLAACGCEVQGSQPA